ncbi:MAG: hypothetical protein ABWK00_00545 [Desulfurococcaceae archaeon]
MSAEQELKRKVLGLIDSSQDRGIKYAFYSNERVKEIMQRLYERWEGAGMKGMPIDYATDEELEALVSVAERVALSGRDYMAEFHMNAYGLPLGERETRRKGLLRRIFGL